MRLKQKSAWIVVGSFLTFGLLAFALFNSFLLREFKNLEDQQAARNVGRVSEAFQQEIRSLIERTRDWAVWDDAYRFVEKHDAEFIESNLSYDAVKSINFNHIIFLSKSANISYALQLDFDAETIGPLSPSAQAALVDTRVFSSILEQQSVGGGLITIDGKTYLVAASPITDSAETLPPNGVLIFTRELTDDSVAQFGEQTKLKIQRASGTTKSPQTQSQSILLDPVQAFQVAAAHLTPTELIGGLLVYDVFGNEVMDLRIPIPRDLHFQGVQIRTYVSYGIALLALMTAGLVTALIDRLVISRIARIGNQLSVIAKEQSFASRVEERGADELTSLSRGINHALAALESAQRDTAEARETAERANEAKTIFFASASHDIRNPLASIKGLIESALRRTIPPEVRELLNAGHGVTLHLSNFVTRLLEFHKAESGKLTFESIEFDIRSLIRDVRTQVIGGLTNQNVELVLDIHPDVPTILVGDPGKIQQVLENLIGNSLKFTHDGAVGLRVNAAPSTANSSVAHRNNLTLEVWDTGIGIPNNKLGAIFEPFRQAEGSTARLYQGTGLGLSICKQIVEGMGGKLSVTSVFGQGSCFTIEVTLPSIPKVQASTLTSWAVPAVLIGEPSPSLEALSRNLNLLGATTVWMKQIPVNSQVDPSLRSAKTVIASESALKSPQIMELVSNRPGFTICLVSPLNAELRGVLHKNKVSRILSSSAIAEEVIEIQARQAAPQPADTNLASINLPKATRPIRVLIADDLPTNRIVAEDLFSQAGYTVLLACDGTEILEATGPMIAGKQGAEQVDIIFTDVSMGTMDGTTAALRIRELEQLHNTGHRIPIVAITAHSSADERKKILSSGIDAIVTKPMYAGEIARVLQSLLKSSS